MRLLTPTDFKRVFQKPSRVADRQFTVLARASVSDSPARLGLAIAKKQARRAVDRNRLKRLIRETFRHQQAALAGYDFVVMTRTTGRGADNERLRASLQRLFMKAIEANQRG
ncbi:ribonuclease P protein component [Thiosocius teredinicola]|uniref:ribonuclease P protein component n=1 Tax=Thiosocius teredinicola TaxID=1973002 RepID=UPI002FE47932